MFNTQFITNVMDFTVERYDSAKRGEIIFSVGYASETSIMAEADRFDITGGIGNYVLGSVDHSKKVSFNAKLPIIDLKALSEKLGTPLETGVKIGTMNEYVDLASDTLTLKESPYLSTITAHDKHIKVYKVNGVRDIDTSTELVYDAVIATGKYTHVAATKVITLNTGDFAEGDTFFVSYDYETGANTKELKVTGNSFPGYIRITGRGQVMDDVEGGLVPISFDIKKAKVNSNFELTMVEGSNSEIDFGCDCFPVTEGCDKIFIEILRLDDETVAC